MTLIADSDVDDPVIRALQEVRYDIKRLRDIGAPVRPDRAVMDAVLNVGNVFVTKDAGIPSQAYYYQFAQNGLTVVLLRWKCPAPRCWQEMVETILMDGKNWEETALRAPHVISVSHRKSRARPWTTIGAEIVWHTLAKGGL